jgi:hypothetical protein
VGDHQRLGAVQLGLAPVVDERRARRVSAGGRDESAALVVGAGKCVHVAVAQRRERVPVPPVALSADVVELDRAQALREGAERAARLYLGQLAVVADEHELRLRAACRVAAACPPSAPPEPCCDRAPCAARSP